MKSCKRYLHLGTFSDSISFMTMGTDEFICGKYQYDIRLSDDHKISDIPKKTY